ncbi:hypothetical protein [Lacticaseibacillus sharpeae]|uniref:hypothetical protein n=1 Tax=Lacticaseibacillus sharpeae TaxID=1626 RepID=UPI000A61F22A|nr:hypothetical protein [Lacticaseibacillus sharpeae]
MTVETMGGFVKRVRQERGVRLTDLTDVGTSSMSRFENDQIDLAGSRLLSTFGLIGIDYRDLNIRHILTVANEDDWQYLATGTWNLAKVQTLRESLVGAQHKIQNLSGYQRMVIACIDELIAIHTGESNQFAPGLVSRVSQYFGQLSTFSGVDLFLIGALIDRVSVEESVSWIMPKVRKIVERQALMTDADVRNNASIVLMVAEQAGNEGQFTIMHRMLTVTKQLIALVPEQVSVAYNFSVSVALMNLLEHNNSTNRRVFARIIDSTRVIFPRSYYEYLSKYVLEQGWVSQAELEQAQ